jgi:pimeloyl-ACP methyl ester carboxylesterase
VVRDYPSPFKRVSLLCYAVDFPSDLGLSSQTNPPANRLDCVAWLRELLDGLGVVMVSFVGASYGSFLALNYAIAEPARVKKVVLSSPAGGIIALRKTFYARLFFRCWFPVVRRPRESCIGFLRIEFRCTTR